ncbi:MAG: arsenosugar biosynthesis radical SAM protein ArsS [Burkholderiales bacterium]|nr:arsenosugar biosynthesis radical SAM protein ArsS [Burkholderiales bacterium]
MSRAVPLRRADRRSAYDFEAALRARAIELAPLAIETLQVNITRMCNQTCRHCHVDASPARTEMMTPETMDKCLDILARHPRIATLDITGGAPELHPRFDEFVARAAALGRRVIVRHNLTVQLDGNPRTGESKEYLPAFFASHRVEVVASLPFYQPYFTDAQRGAGVFAKSIEALRRLNAVGYGAAGSGLVLNLVYNPVGPYLPPPQAALEADYKRELAARFGIVFNRLYTITNMPINRFRLHLAKAGQYDAYMEKLLAAFNPAAAEGVMCRTLVSVGWDGRIYDCDFNQMAEMPAMDRNGRPLTVHDFDFGEVLGRGIRFASHCFGCTAGAGSSCGGALA